MIIIRSNNNPKCTNKINLRFWTNNYYLIIHILHFKLPIKLQ